MRRPSRIPNLGGARAIVLHQAHAGVDILMRQLRAIGLEAEQAWPEPPASAPGADFLFFDVDMGFDEQFPWSPGEAPMPLVALIGSEAPGRIEWALSQRADAQIVKPVGNSGVYSALLIARRAFDERRRLAAEIADLEARIADRRIVLRAVMALGEGADEELAYARLRALAMSWQVTIEEAARRVNAMKSEEGSHDRPARA